MARKAKDTPHLRLRVEPSLLARLEKSAEKNERTLTGEIVHRLEESFKRYDTQAAIENTGRAVAEALLLSIAAREGGQSDDEIRKITAASAAKIAKGEV
jgi:hypothetical protein